MFSFYPFLSSGSIQAQGLSLFCSRASARGAAEGSQEGSSVQVSTEQDNPHEWMPRSYSGFTLNPPTSNNGEGKMTVNLHGETYFSPMFKL